MAIEARHYQHTREALTRDPVIKALAEAMRPIEPATYRMPGGDPRWEFTQAALREYRKRAAELRAAGMGAALYPEGAPMHIGAPAEAILLILDGKAPAGGPSMDDCVPELTASEAVALATQGKLLHCPRHGQVLIRVATMDYRPATGWAVTLECGCPLTDGDGPAPPINLPGGRR